MRFSINAVTETAISDGMAGVRATLGTETLFKANSVIKIKREKVISMIEVIIAVAVAIGVIVEAIAKITEFIG